MSSVDQGNQRGSILLLGGRSEIGLEVAKRLAPGRAVLLAARRSGDLADETALLMAAGATAVHQIEFDADDVASHADLLEAAADEHGPVNVVLVAFGILGDQDAAERDAAHAIEIIQTDFVAQVSVLTILANLLKVQGSGRLVVFSSIAGARVRRANYVYGAAKAGLDGFASGLQDALEGTGVDLLLVRPGFVAGRMTEGMAPVPLLSSTPEQVAAGVVAALEGSKRQVWIPRHLAVLARVIQVVPRSLWRRIPR